MRSLLQVLSDHSVWVHLTHRRHKTLFNALAQSMVCQRLPQSCSATTTLRSMGVDTRSVRFPGLISYVTPPGGGTTDYAVDIYYAAVRGEKFVCPIKKGNTDGHDVHARWFARSYLIDGSWPNSFGSSQWFQHCVNELRPWRNLQCYQALQAWLWDGIRRRPTQAGIADSWPDSLDDSCARAEWDWKPQYDLDAMTVDMLKNLEAKLK